MNNDLIYRQQAIDAICEDGTWLERQGCVDITMAERKQRDVEIIENLPSAQPEQQWIPVSERLPVEEGDYLTTTIHGNVFCDYWNGLNFNRTEMVIAWMPLPEPYQGERKTDE